MTDDAFQLTPHDVRGQEFQKALRGYDAREVEAFKERMADEIERLIRERVQLEERLRNFQEQLRAFRERERAMNEALVAAQQLRVEAEEQAGRQAEGILRDAKAEALRVVSQAKETEQLTQERIIEARRQFARYVTNFRALLERQMGEVEGLESHIRVSEQPQTEMPLKREA